MADKPTKTHYFCNEVLTADTPNINGLTYPREVLERAVEDAQDRVNSGDWLGELNSMNYTTKLGFASHQITALRMEGDKVVAEVKCLDTIPGKILQEMLAHGAPTLAPVGKGNVNDKTISNYSIGSIHVDTHAKKRE